MPPPQLTIPLCSLRSLARRYCTERAAGGEGGDEPKRKKWARWLESDEYNRVVGKLSKDLQVTNQIQNIERGVTAEVGRLRELGVYPSAELVLIRRQFKMLEQEFGEVEGGAGEGAAGGREEAELELEFCERKRQLLRHRRMEVEGDSVVRAVREETEGGAGGGGENQMWVNAPANMPAASASGSGAGGQNPYRVVEQRLQQQRADAPARGEREGGRGGAGGGEGGRRGGGGEGTPTARPAGGRA
jgi:hypothetical protein